MNAPVPTAVTSVFWRITAVILTLILVGILFSHIGLGWFMVIAVIAAFIINFGFRGWGLARTVGNIVLFLILTTTACVRDYFPNTTRWLSTVGRQVDVGIGQSTIDLNKTAQEIQTDNAAYIDSVSRAHLNRAWASWKERVAKEGLTNEVKREHDSLIDVQRLLENDERKVKTGEKLLDTQPRSALDTLKISPNKPDRPRTLLDDTLRVPHSQLLIVDLSETDPTEMEIPAGFNALIWIDSAWYSIYAYVHKHRNDPGFTSYYIPPLNAGDYDWCDANGYGLTAANSIAQRYCKTEYYAPKLNIACTIYKRGNDEWRPLTMGSKLLVDGSLTDDVTLKVAVNVCTAAHDNQEGVLSIGYLLVAIGDAIDFQMHGQLPSSASPATSFPMLPLTDTETPHDAECSYWEISKHNCLSRGVTIPPGHYAWISIYPTPSGTVSGWTLYPGLPGESRTVMLDPKMFDGNDTLRVYMNFQIVPPTDH